MINGDVSRCHSYIGGSDHRRPGTKSICHRLYLVYAEPYAGEDLRKSRGRRLDVSSENLKLLEEESQMVDTETLMRYIRIFSDLSSQIRYATQKRVLIEIGLIKLCRPAMETNLDSVLDRLRVLEQRIDEECNSAADCGTIRWLANRRGAACTGRKEACAESST